MAANRSDREYQRMINFAPRVVNAREAKILRGVREKLKRSLRRAATAAAPALVKMVNALCRIRTYNQRIMLTPTAFAALLLPGSRSLWSGLSLRFTRLPSSLYTFHASSGVAWLGITISLSQLRLPRI